MADSTDLGSVRRRAIGTRGHTVLALVATLALGAVLQVLGAPLVGPDTPLGVVSLQFVADHARAVELVAGWGEAGRTRAIQHLLVDLAFPLAYASAIAAVASGIAARPRVGARTGPAGATRGVALAGAVAAGLDLVENGAMLATVTDRGGDWSTRLTVAMAVPKFALLGAAVAALVVLLIATSPRSALRRGRAG